MNFIKQYHKKLTREMLEESIFIIDTNCLLSSLKDYVIGDKILEAFEKITNSTYIPFITQVEYLENELSVINNRKRNVGEVIMDIRLKNSAGQLKFMNSLVQEQWEQLCQRKKI